MGYPHGHAVSYQQDRAEHHEYGDEHNAVQERLGTAARQGKNVLSREHASRIAPPKHGPYRRKQHGQTHDAASIDVDEHEEHAQP